MSSSQIQTKVHVVLLRSMVLVHNTFALVVVLQDIIIEGIGNAFVIREIMIGNGSILKIDFLIWLGGEIAASERVSWYLINRSHVKWLSV